MPSNLLCPAERLSGMRQGDGAQDGCRAEAFLDFVHHIAELRFFVPVFEKAELQGLIGLEPA